MHYIWDIIEINPAKAMNTHCIDCDGCRLSDCCNAPIDTDILICSDCKEHCGTMCDDCDEGDDK